MMNAPTINAMNPKVLERDVEEAQRLVDVVLLLLGDLGAGQHLDLAVAVLGQRLLDVVLHLLFAHARLRDHRDLAELADRVADALHLVEREQTDRRPEQAVGGAEAGDADDVVEMRPLRGQHLHPVADFEVALVGAVPVDHDLVVALRRATRDDPELVERAGSVCHARPNVGRSVAADRLTLLVDELGVALGAVDVATGGRDARHLLHDGERRLRNVRSAGTGPEIASRALPSRARPRRCPCRCRRTDRRTTARWLRSAPSVPEMNATPSTTAIAVSR